jgi:hypothetical protein
MGDYGDPLIYNPTDDTISAMPSSREAIRGIYVVNEPMQLVVNMKDAEGKDINFTRDVVPGDIIIRFWETAFPNRVIVINSKEWMENLDAFAKYLKKRDEQNKCANCVKGCCDACISEAPKTIASNRQ